MLGDLCASGVKGPGGTCSGGPAVLGSELARWKRLLLELPLYLLGLFALLAGLGAYQVRAAHVIDVGGPYDFPYLSSFHEPEPDPSKFPQAEVTYRWTRERVGIALPGLGRGPWLVRLRMQAYRPSEALAPRVELWCRGQLLVATTVAPFWQVYEVLVPPALLPDGDLRLELRAQTFRPEGDPRDLGVTLDWIAVRPAATGWMEPAWGQVGSLVAVALLSYLLLRRLGLGQGWTAGLVVAVSFLLAYLLACRRPWLTGFAPTLALLLGGGLVVTALVLPWIERRGVVWAESLRRRAWRREARLLWAILLLGFLLRLGGMLYPQFRTSDLTMHVHNLRYDVLPGELFFTERLPDINLPAPYPPGLYVALAPWTLLTDNLPVLMELAGVSLDAAAGVLLYWLARRLGKRGDVALLAVLLQQAAPVTYQIFAWGNYTNIFSRATLLMVLVVLAVGTWPRQGWRGVAVLSASFTLVLLSHFADSLIFGLLLLATVGLALLSRAGRPAVPRLLVALVVAGGVVLALYYSAPPIWAALQGGLEVLGAGAGRSGGLLDPLPQFLGRVQAPLLLLGLPGLLLLPKAARRWPAVVLGAALLTAAAFGLGYALFGFSSRYDYFILPVLALGAGLVLAGLRRRGWAGRLGVGLLVLYLVGNGVWTWCWLVGNYMR